jgi:hypothetical protein
MPLIEILKRIMVQRRLVYHFFSGLMFLALSVTLFFWSGRLVTFFSILLFAYAVYRFIMFAWLLRKELRDQGNGNLP